MPSRSEHRMTAPASSDPFPLRDVAIALAEQARLFRPALEHFGECGEPGERRGRDEQDLWRPAPRADAVGAGDGDEARGAFGDVEGGNGKALLQVVATESDNEEVERHMAHEAGRQGVRSAAMGLDRIVV